MKTIYIAIDDEDNVAWLYKEPPKKLDLGSYIDSNGSMIDILSEDIVNAIGIQPGECYALVPTKVK